MSDGLGWVDDPGSLASLMDGDAGIVTAVGFPWGLRCADCSDEMPEGTAYVSWQIDVASDGTPMCLILCCGCAVVRSLTGGRQ